MLLLASLLPFLSDGRAKASASLETHYGTIQVSIKKKGKRMKFDLQIPEGTSAELIKPNGTRKHLGPGHHWVD